jgi:dienelactone hydrolase
MGLNDYIKRRTREMAELGFVAFAADVYGKGVRPKNVEEAAAQATKYKTDRRLLRQRVNAAYNWLANNKRVDSKKVVAMGYCFGGTAALELARSGTLVRAVVSFHGGLDSPTPADGKNIKAKILALHGAVDPYMKPEELAAFKKELDDAKVDYQLVMYANTVHAFTNPDAGNDPSKGAAYNPVSDKRSFAAMKQFLSEVLAQ